MSRDGRKLVFDDCLQLPPTRKASRAKRREPSETCRRRATWPQVSHVFILCQVKIALVTNLFASADRILV
jgi:hypothetical protein